MVCFLRRRALCCRVQSNAVLTVVRMQAFPGAVECHYWQSADEREESVVQWTAVLRGGWEVMGA